MTRISWHEGNSRTFETGLDRGVLYLKNGAVVPWNGLVSVDEEGAESATAYYIDGQPYLFLPKRKEFAAALKAYTYPDEFASTMGLTEVADGMYLDSQAGDSFDLCYRTLIGNGIDGSDVGYKIHLVYNVTVVPQSLSYASVGSSVDPLEFSWEIRAVPVSLAGHHPTAHIIIDTRHLSPEKIMEIEDFLYGTSSITVTALPRPTVLFDTLNFDDTVIITDNHDGTWTATGSYGNIVVASNGSFIINNVLAVTNPDGVYFFDDEFPPQSESDLEGGTPSSSGLDEYDGGTPSFPGGSVYDGGSP